MQNKTDQGIEPGSSGSMTFYIISHKDGPLSVKLNLTLTGYQVEGWDPSAATKKGADDTSTVTVQSLKEADSTAQQLLEGHVLLLSLIHIYKGTNTNTYTVQLDSANYKNGKTRYYYNLDSYRKDKYTTDLKIINTVEDLVLWSAAQYAAENIRTCFRKEITSTPENLFITSISGDLNLDGYSYYPVTPLTIVHIGSENENDTENKTTLTLSLIHI